MSERERVQHLGLQLFGFVIMSVSMMFMCAEMFKRRTAVSVRITLVVVTVCVVGIAVAIVIAFAMALRRASRRSRKQKSTQRKHKQTKEIELPELTEDRQPSATHTIAPPSMLDDDSDIDESLSLNTTVSAKSPAISLARPHQPPTASNSPHNEQKSDKLAGKDTAPSAKMPVFEKDSKFRPSLSQNVVRHTPEEPSQLTQRSRKVASNHRNQVSSTIQAPPFHATLSEDKPSELFEQQAPIDLSSGNELQTDDEDLLIDMHAGLHNLTELDIDEAFFSRPPDQLPLVTPQRPTLHRMDTDDAFVP